MGGVLVVKFHLISDNKDTFVGMRLVGIPGVVVHKEDEIKTAINEAIKDEDIAVVLITENLVKICREFIYDIKLNHSRPLIVEIPDRHGNGRAKDSITKYVRDAIGIKI